MPRKIRKTRKGQARFLFLFVLLFILFIVTPFIFGQPVLVYGYDDDYLPWEKNEEGVPTGVNIDIMRLIAQRLGYEIRFESYPFRRILLLMESGEIDMTGGLALRPEREEYIHYLQQPYQRAIKIFMAPKDSPVTLSTYEELYDLRIGLRAGNKQFDRFDNDPDLVKIEANSVDQLFQMLLLGRFDVAVGGSVQLRYGAKTGGFSDQLKVLDYQEDLGVGGYFGISRKSPFMARREEIEAVLVDLFSSGKIDAIIETYF